MNNIELAIYNDDKRQFTVGNNIGELKVKVKNASKIPFQWFSYNQVKSNPGKCNFIFSVSN